METHHYWEDNGHSNKFEKYNITEDYGTVGNEHLNFAVPSEDEDYQQAGEYPATGYVKKGKLSRQDPMSHRIIEKRRRDRMNNCLADLSHLIPSEYLKKGRGRVEKTEIIEMAIRHLKYLQDRINAAERQTAADEYRAGFQEAMSEAVRFLVDVKGYGQSEGVCSQLAAHLQRHSELLFKGNPLRRNKILSQPVASSEAGGKANGLHGYAPNGVITRLGPDPQEFYPMPYEPKCVETYPMECEKDLIFQSPTPLEAETGPEPLPQDNRQKRETTLRTVRKPEHNDDYLHSYKFKNSIERRFSMSQDCQVRKNDDKTAVPTPEATDMSVRFKYNSKRRCPNAKPAAPAPDPATCARSSNSNSASNSTSYPNSTLSSHSTSASNSASNDDAQDNSPRRETSLASVSPDHQHFDKPSPTQFVPVFALNTQGKYYVPLSVEWACVSRQLRACGAGAARPTPPPLHPVTIYVNFQPCLDYHVKQEPDPADWQP